LSVPPPGAPYNRTGRSLGQFKQTILKSGGLQQVSRYEVLFSVPSLGLATLKTYPENVTMPPRSFQTTPYTNWGPDFNIPTKREYGECAMSFYIYQDWYERRYFETWMNGVIPPNPASDSASAAGLGAVEIALGAIGAGGASGFLQDRSVGAENYADYTRPYSSFSGLIQINCLSVDSNSADPLITKNDITASMLMRDAYPLSITPTTLSAEASGYGTMVVVFTFRDYTFY